MTIVPLDHLWVEANLRETELQHIRPGQSALVNVSLYGEQHTFHGTVEGLVPGSGSAFALLPPDNATGNFIHIVERVPVRIALLEQEIREYPVRPGLSTVTKINIGETGQSVWSSSASPSTAEYATDVYADELPTAEAMAKEVMTHNLVVASSDEPDDLLLAREDGSDRPTDLEQGTWRKLKKTTSPLDSAVRSEHVDHTPRSFVPRHSPDMGVTASPLTPSIGPGSGLLGPEGGRSPSRLRLDMDQNHGRRSFDSR